MFLGNTDTLLLIPTYAFVILLRFSRFSLRYSTSF